jgi:hypothetical protein
MAGKTISSIHAAITGSSSTGYVTVGSSAGFYVGAKVYLTKSTTHQPAEIVSISGNNLFVRFMDNRFTMLQQGTGFGVSNTAAPVDFNSGTIDMEEQFIYNVNDLPLS